MAPSERFLRLDFQRINSVPGVRCEKFGCNYWDHKSDEKSFQRKHITNSYVVIFDFVTLICTVNSIVNPFHATGLFLYPLKTSTNLWFSDTFRGYGKRPVT